MYYQWAYQMTLLLIMMSNQLNTYMLVDLSLSMYYHTMYMLSSPPQSMGFYVLGRQLDEILASLATSNSVRYDIFVTCLCISVIIIYFCWKWTTTTTNNTTTNTTTSLSNLTRDCTQNCSNKGKISVKIRKWFFISCDVSCISGDLCNLFLKFFEVKRTAFNKNE